MVESGADFAGVPDGFQRLWTPHRLAYIEQGQTAADAGSGCVFCTAPTLSDELALIVHRGT
ncbi:MAG TPA: HIT family hydrolase, partial [Pseudolysinimonas sp.]